MLEILITDLFCRSFDAVALGFDEDGRLLVMSFIDLF
jgi:hypothetical protein